MKHSFYLTFYLFLSTSGAEVDKNGRKTCNLSKKVVYLRSKQT